MTSTKKHISAVLTATILTTNLSIPAMVAEQIIGFGVAVARSEGSAEITASNSAGEHGSITLTVGSATPATPETFDSVSLMGNLEIRQGDNPAHQPDPQANEVPELPANEALMNAA